MRKKAIRLVKYYILCWDFLLSLLIALFVFCQAPFIPLSVIKDVSSVSISLAAIIFSVFFAALTIIISGGDNDFVVFLEEKGVYTGTLCSFQFSLVLTFLNLLVSIFLYILAVVKGIISGLYPWQTSLYAFLFFYSLFAVLNSTFESIHYAKTRARYLTYKEDE